MKFVVVAIALLGAFACPDEKNYLACSVKNEKYVCAYCYLGWVDSDGKCVILPIKERLDNCNLYATKAKDKPAACANCALGYTTDDTEKCVQCKIPGCALCDKPDSCKACANGKKLELKPALKCTDDAADVPNCEVCDYVSPASGCRCQKCKSGFAINLEAPQEKACVEDKVGSCFVLERGNLNKCAYCAFGYYVSKDGKCLNNNREAFGWGLVVLLALVVLSIPLIWWCYKKRKESSSASYTQRLVN